LERSELLGPTRRIVLARAVDERIRKSRSGSGGAVTALLASGLAGGEFDAVVATIKSRGIEGRAVVITDRDTLLRAAGSRWTLVENLKLLHQALSSYRVRKAAVVCTPCQAHFLKQTATFPLVEGTDFSERIALVVGLFCMGTFSQPSFTAFLRRRFGVSPEEVTDVSLREGALHVEVEGRKAPLRIPVAEAVEFVNLGCLLCEDYTASDADISAGVAAAARGWTVLVARTKRGAEMLEKGEAHGFIETAQAPEDVLVEILQRAEEKMRRAVEYKLRFV